MTDELLVIDDYWLLIDESMLLSLRQILCYPRHCIVCKEGDGDLVGKMVNVEVHQLGVGEGILYSSALDEIKFCAAAVYATVVADGWYGLSGIISAEES